MSKQNALFSINYREPIRVSICVRDDWQNFLMNTGKMPLNFRRILINFLQCKIIENILELLLLAVRAENLLESGKFSLKIPCNYLPVPPSIPSEPGTYMRELHTTSHISLKFPFFKGGTEQQQRLCCLVSFHKHHTFTQPVSIVNFHMHSKSFLRTQKFSELEMRVKKKFS